MHCPAGECRHSPRRDTLKSFNLRSIPGVGPVLTAILIAEMPEPGATSDAQIAALAGLAPIARDSGNMRGKRSIGGGRRQVRHVLYQAALVAAQHNPVLRAFAIRLRERGKPHKVIITAVARKLLTIANAICKRNFPWQKNWANQDTVARLGNKPGNRDRHVFDGLCLDG